MSSTSVSPLVLFHCLAFAVCSTSTFVLLTASSLGPVALLLIFDAVYAVIFALSAEIALWAWLFVGRSAAKRLRSLVMTRGSRA